MTLITSFPVNWVDSSTCKGLNTLLGSRSALKNHILNVETRVLFLIRKPERAKKCKKYIFSFPNALFCRNCFRTVWRLWSDFRRIGGFEIVRTIFHMYSGFAIAVLERSLDSIQFISRWLGAGELAVVEYTHGNCCKTRNQFTSTYLLFILISRIAELTLSLCTWRVTRPVCKTLLNRRYTYITFGFEYNTCDGTKRFYATSPLLHQ